MRQTRSGGLEYRATTAQWHADLKAKRPQVAKLAAHDELRRYVQDRLAGRITAADGTRVPDPHVHWNGRRHGAPSRPDAGRRHGVLSKLPTDSRSTSPMMSRCGSPTRPSTRRSTCRDEGHYAADLVACLRTGRALRMPRARTRGRGKAFVRSEIMISKRPAEADDRAVPGHWEGDLIVGLGSSAIGTLVERTSRITMLLHLPRMDDYGQPRIKNGPALAGHGAEAVRDAIASSIITLPQQLRRSLTWDQGAEMSQHVQLRIDTGLPIYFCDPHSPWQRGTNENTNGLLRQYFPKGTDLSRHSRDDLDAVATASQQSPPQDPRLEDTRGGTWRSPMLNQTTRRCDDTLNPPCTP